MIKAIIFDFDGTILDTETASYEAWSGLYRQYGLKMSVEEWGRFIGTSNKEDNPYTFIQRNVPGFSVSEKDLRAKVKQTVMASISDKDLLPGVKSLLNHARERQVRLAIATSSARKTVIEHLQTYDLEPYFEVFSTRDDVQTVKPNPELYLKAIEALQVKKEEVIAIEDSPNGALAAKRAGIRCVVVPNDMTKNLAFPEVDVVLETLEDFDIDWLSKS